MGGPGSGGKPRQYPPEIVSLICGMYRDGMTVAEIRKVAPKGYRVQTILERYLPVRRPAAKRNQVGEANHAWKGEQVGYQAAHLRLGDSTIRQCVDCGEQAREWSYKGNCPDEQTDQAGRRYSVNPAMYEPRCRACHRKYDFKGRRANGQFVAREEVMPNVR